MDEYGGETLFLPKTNPKPDDYNATFEGNVDDNFKIGISLTKKTVKVRRYNLIYKVRPDKVVDGFIYYRI